jgi:nanoRNase/pAp phosphatase (c-di-AMP/oligoRNAs hydrolase)
VVPAKTQHTAKHQSRASLSEFHHSRAASSMGDSKARVLDISRRRPSNSALRFQAGGHKGAASFRYPHRDNSHVPHAAAPGFTATKG